MQCIVCVYCIVPFDHKAVMVKIICIFQLILAVDFIAFYLTKIANFTLISTKKLQLLGPLIGFWPWTPLGDLRPPDAHACCVPSNHGDRWPAMILLMTLWHEQYSRSAMCDCACLSAVCTITFESKMEHLNFEAWYSDASWTVFDLPNPNPDSD